MAFVVPIGHIAIPNTIVSLELAAPQHAVFAGDGRINSRMCRAVVPSNRANKIGCPTTRAALCMVAFLLYTELCFSHACPGVISCKPDNSAGLVLHCLLRLAEFPPSKRVLIFSLVTGSPMQLQHYPLSGMQPCAVPRAPPASHKEHGQ